MGKKWSWLRGRGEVGGRKGLIEKAHWREDLKEREEAVQFLRWGVPDRFTGSWRPVWLRACEWGQSRISELQSGPHTRVEHVCAAVHGSQSSRAALTLLSKLAQIFSQLTLLGSHPALVENKHLQKMAGNFTLVSFRGAKYSEGKPISIGRKAWTVLFLSKEGQGNYVGHNYVGQGGCTWGGSSFSPFLFLRSLENKASQCFP